MIHVDNSKLKEKASLDWSSIDSIVEKPGEIKISDPVDGAESKDMFVAEGHILVHETEIFVTVIPLKKARKKMSSKQNNINGN